jgi:hypothetical protein
MFRMLEELSRQAPKGQRGMFKHLLAETKPIMDSLKRQEEISAAVTALEPHRAEFCKLVEDKAAYLERSQALFAEERFSRFRFTAADVRRAFERVGYLGHIGVDEKAVETIRAAILFLADAERRKELARELAGHIPHYVAAGRYLDGWIVQRCAYATAEELGESNPFLFQMFSHGYNVWQEEQMATGEALLREAGFDIKRLRGLTFEEIEAELEAMQADPEKRARLEAILEANPDQRAQATTRLVSLERSSVKLLERQDARALLLPVEEIEPCMPVLNRRLESVMKGLPDVDADTPAGKEAARLFQEELFLSIREMARMVFTPDRRARLLAELKKYRNERFAADDKNAAELAAGAIMSVEREEDPGENYFLVTLCFRSLQALRDPTKNPAVDDEQTDEEADEESGD